MLLIPVSMIILGIGFLGSGAFLIFRLLRQTLYYRVQWISYLLLIAFFILSYAGCIVYGIYYDPHCLNYWYATLFLLGGVYVYLSCNLMTNTMNKMELMDDITLRYELLKQRSTLDSLTECLTRDYLLEVLNHRFQKIKLDEGMLVILFIDMDGFKAINDNHGHDIGDKALQQFTQLLKRRLRKEDLVCRYGGDEFIVLMEHIAIEDAQKIASDIVRRARQLSQDNVQLTGCSIGIAVLNKHSSSINEVIKKADIACYAAKQKKSKNSVCLYSHALSAANHSKN
ncbi:TPA: GGDEF domain-containing protein [Legionella pneumophila]|uniref:GGDEF domain-containing protein n=1 Tax=Legionella TaxID=445 RepID=UPI00077079F2|nr:MULTISPECIES: GGDEF domain-containing protein [Legionella]MDW8855000.1 GGDEF domain-containing protein [Legionella pneumophila]MDW8922276.1 GGDEF domain-containing protein [Legionella pneumophila]CZP44741.1 Probable diguanylate cyclase AdrA [Legionella pneumophila]CZP75854.1 Probable diguanylate cyclase AdrA [Legionella pneumophila]CZP82799.1 Probable diguanylate cyclase AdrA [Legionella pneumophila]